MLALCLVFVVSLLAYFIGIKPLKYWKERGVLSPQPWFIFGHLGPKVFGKRSIAQILDDTYNAFPAARYAGFYLFTQPILMLRDLDLIKKIAVKDFDAFPEHRTFVSEEIDPLWAKGLFGMQGGEKWHNLRATLSPSFTANKMKIMFGPMKRCAKQLSDYLLKQKDRISVDAKDIFGRFTNDVIAITAFGVNCNSLEDPDNEFYFMGKEATDASGIRGYRFILNTISPTLMKLLRMPIYSKSVRKFFTNLIKDTIRIRVEKGIIRLDMIHLLMKTNSDRLKENKDTAKVLNSEFSMVSELDKQKNQKKQLVEITDEEITAHALIFFFAGFDTFSTVMSFAALELALNPEIQNKLREEIDKTLKAAQSELTYETLLEMRYLDMVISETLRKWPPFIILDRKSSRPYIIPPEKLPEKPLHLPEGTICFIPVYSIHRDPQNYPNPDKFDPERFSERNKHNIKPFSYLPFGLGPRNCIGMRFALLECKLAIAEIISKFEILPVKKTHIPLKLAIDGFSPMPEGGYWLEFKPRNL